MNETLIELRARRDAVDHEIAAMETELKSAALDQALRILGAAGISAADASAMFLRAAKAPIKPSKKVAPRYRHIPTGKTWSGRGKTPLWYSSADQATEIENLVV